MRYALRYTNDLYVINEGDDIASLIPQFGSDYKVHIWDRVAGRVVWQNGQSERYGHAGVRNFFN